jgi:predicted RNase H-like HicB family nuclease
MMQYIVVYENKEEDIVSIDVSGNTRREAVENANVKIKQYIEDMDVDDSYSIIDIKNNINTSIPYECSKNEIDIYNIENDKEED